MILFSLSFAAIVSAPVIADTPEPRTCNASDFQACKSCHALTKATAKAEPNGTITKQ